MLEFFTRKYQRNGMFHNGMDPYAIVGAVLHVP